MRRRLTFIVASVAAIAVLLVGGTAAVATQTDDADSEQERVTGAAADQVRAAGLKEAGGGTVVEMERDPEGQRIYKVEVRRANGTTVDVNLNRSFEVVPEAEDDANEANERDDNDNNEPNERDDSDADDRNDTDD